MMRSGIWVAPFALLALAGCEDRAAQEKIAAEAKAKAAAAAKARQLADALAVNIRCYAAIKWQQNPLQRGGIGDPKLYLVYYRDMIEKRLGDTIVPVEPPKPELSAANLDSYLDWAVKDHVDTQFSDPATRNRAHMTVAGCVQSAAEFGAGPMAGMNPAQRYEKMLYLRDHLNKRGN